MSRRAPVEAPAPRSAAEFFGDRAAFYDSQYDGADADAYALRSRMDAVVELLGPGPGEVLDAGMGPGRLCAELARSGWRASGVDASEAMVEVARARLPEARDRLATAPIEDLPFGDGTFDAVTATGVLEYSEVPRALAEIHRVLRPGGRAVVSYPNPEAYFGMWKTRRWYPAVRAAKRLLRRPDPHMPRGAGELPPPTFLAALRRAGFEVHGHVYYTSYMPALTPVELIAPAAVASLGRRAERRRLWSRRLATQVVYQARKPLEGGPR